MRTSLLLAALLAVASGCDSVVPPAERGPVIEFGSTSVNVTENEDGTPVSVEIPVTLSGGETGQSYTVEVLLATASSTTSDTDISEFGAEAGGNRVATVTLTGPKDTVTVAVDVLQDDELEGSESAVFVLQRAAARDANGRASIGDNRQFRLDIGTPAIADTRARPDGDIVTVEGIVTARFGRYTFLQDQSAGIAIYAFDDREDPDDFFDANIGPGDRIQVKGSLSEFGARDGAGLGLKQVFIGRDSPATFTVLSRGNDLPEAQKLTVAQIVANGERYESERVRVTGLRVVGSTDVVFQAGGSAGNYTVSDGTGEMILRINSAAEGALGGQPVPQGEFTFVGPVGQFGGNYQLTPTVTTDLDED